MLSAIFIVAVLAACVVIYVTLIRPKLHAIEALDPHFDRADAFWARLWARTHGWRVELFSFVGIAIAELPDLIDMVSGVNLAAFVPQEYQRGLQMALLGLAVVRAWVTKRAAEKKLGE